tara:strand:- start:1354 stop:1467 length:114 start_codon:yes stop_codon:yes gene_type:complete
MRLLDVSGFAVAVSELIQVPPTRDVFAKQNDRDSIHN